MIARYWHTLRHLRPVQFYGRLWFRLYRPTPDRHPAPEVRPVPGRWVAPVAKPVSLLGPKTFRFLNETHALAGAGHEAAGGRDSWNDPARDKLWLYNLHYFDDLNASPSPPAPPPRRGEGSQKLGFDAEGGKKLGLDADGVMPAAQISSLTPSPLVGEGWGEGEHTESTQRHQWHLALLQRWVNENPPGHGNGWEPYLTSLRIVNWIKWSLTIPPDGGGVAVALPPACLQSLAVQTRWLSRRLEHHLLGNHLFANAKALVYAGAFFVGPEADRWRTLGLRLLARELAEQILPDGGHFERSPMYHAILLEDVLDLINLAGAYPGLLDDAVLTHCRVKAVAMRDWLAVMTHPDGEISFFNDAAFGIAPTLADLGCYADRIPTVSQAHPSPSAIPATTPFIPAEPYCSVIPAGKPESSAMEGSAAVVRRVGAVLSPTVPGLGPGFPAGTTGDGGPSGGTIPVIPPGMTDVPCGWLRDSGYVRLAAGPAVALLDVAPIGPDYLPGHAHADTLSFELSLFGQRVIVNGGTSRYGSGPERLAERGTAAHSTVQIDGADSSEVWGGFRVARRARPLDVAVSIADSPVPATAEPEGGGPDRGDQAAHGASSRRQGCRVSAAHDGYRRLPGRPVHRRRWCLTGEGLVVSDVLEGDFAEAVARFHLHPAVRIERDQIAPGDAADTRPNPVATLTADANPAQRASGTWLLPEGQAVAWRVTGGQARLVASHWHPQFGLSMPSLCLEVSIAGHECRFELSWAAV